MQITHTCRYQVSILSPFTWPDQYPTLPTHVTHCIFAEYIKLRGTLNCPYTEPPCSSLTHLATILTLRVGHLRITWFILADSLFCPFKASVNQLLPSSSKPNTNTNTYAQQCLTWRVAPLHWVMKLRSHFIRHRLRHISPCYSGHKNASRLHNF